MIEYFCYYLWKDICEGWIRLTRKQYWIVEEPDGDYVYFTNRKKAVNVAYLAKQNLYKYYLSKDDGWICQLDLTVKEIYDKGGVI